MSCRCPANTAVHFGASGAKCVGAEKNATVDEQKKETSAKGTLTTESAAPVVDSKTLTPNAE
ncbi:MAG: hypothetical protein HY075_01930 [Deltaproteobacteria bacterium]|nr:hypothetical protein [Deltaproteobacteria bacterium]